MCLTCRLSKAGLFASYFPFSALHSSFYRELVFWIVTLACCSLFESTSDLHTFGQEYSLVGEETGKPDAVFGYNDAEESGMPYSMWKRKRKALFSKFSFRKSAEDGCQCMHQAANKTTRGH